MQMIDRKAFLRQLSLFSILTWEDPSIYFSNGTINSISGAFFIFIHRTDYKMKSLCYWHDVSWNIETTLLI